MKQIDVSAPVTESPFDYFCPICGIELARSNYETLDRDYFCPYCSTQQTASRVPARSRW